jgi:predicted dinucleotide-binding enzyme
MKIAVIGAGRVGGTAARLLAEAGHEVEVANSRGPASLADAQHLLDGAQPADGAEAVAGAWVVLLALPWRERDGLAAYGPWYGKVVIDATNPYGEKGEVLDLGGRTSTEHIVETVVGARVVKAFNTMHWMRLRDEGRADLDLAQRLAIFVAGDDAAAKELVSGLIADIGFAPVDAGPLVEGGRRLEPGTELYNVPLVPAQAEEILRG